MPDSMLAEIEERRPKGVRRSEYVRQAIQARFDAEDDGTWTHTEDDVEATEQPVDA